jgi:hypothetical protein
LSEESKEHAELVAGIVKRLSQADDPDDIILDICQRSGYSWAAAESLVHYIREDQAPQITQKQMPFLIGVALFVFTAGLILTGYGVYAILSAALAARGELVPRDLTWYFMPVLEKGVHPADAFQPAIFPYLNLIVGMALSPISALLFGLCMIFGSLLGMRDAWSTLLNTHITK